MTTPANGQIFVYGTLRSGFQNPAYAYISNYFSLVGPAKVKGHLYDMGDYPAAKPTEEPEFIVGELYQINHPDEWSWAIAQLDDYEGIHIEQGETAMYYREETTVYINDVTTTACVYWYAGDTSQHPIVESGDILQYIAMKSKN